MRYSYSVIEGFDIQKEELVLPRAIKIAQAVINNPYCLPNSISFRRKDNSEIILITLDIEVYQKRMNGIQTHEDIAIICFESDKDFPEVYALRNDFYLGLPHTFARIEERPVRLCISESNFSEIKHKFNAFEFVESIRRWFSLTSQGKLHNEDQPLEAFFVTSGYVVLPNVDKTTTYENFYISPYDVNSNIYKFHNTSSTECPYWCFKLIADSKVHGFVRRMPVKIEDVSDFISVEGVAFHILILNLFEKRKSSFLDTKFLLQKKIAIFIDIPVKRNNKENHEQSERIFITIEKTIEEIGIAAGVWCKEGSNLVYIFGKSFELDFIKKIPIKVLSVMYNFNKTSAAVYNNMQPNNDKFALIGAGALGSQVLSLFARIGYGDWTIIDFDRLYPHNLARHALGRNALGCNKAVKLAEQVNDLLEEHFATAIDANFINNYNDDLVLKPLKESAAIIDISTSLAVSRIIARDYKDTIRAQRISSFLNPSGTDLVILAEDKQRKHRLDFLEMQYYRFLYQNPELHSHLQFSQTSKVRYVRNSCREITSKINETDIAMHASICSKTIIKCIAKGKPMISVWSINQTNYEVRNFSVKPSHWFKYEVNDWKIYIDKWLIEQIKKQRIQKLPNETGGIFIGSIDNERKIIYLIDTILAPNDSIESETSFIRGIENLSQSYKNYLRITDNQILYIGEWHSHPQKCSAKPSSYDQKLFYSLMEKMSKQGYPFLMGIFADNEITLTINNE